MTKSRRYRLPTDRRACGPGKMRVARTKDTGDLRRPPLTVNQARLRLRGIALAVLAIAACAPAEPPAQTGGGPGAVATAPDGVALQFLDLDLVDGDEVAARVGDTVISVDDVRREAAARELVEEADVLHPAAPVFRRTLQDLIDQRLLALEAASRGLHDDREARRRLAAAQERILGNILVEAAVSDFVTEEAVNRVYDEQSRLAPAAVQLRARHILVDTREEADEVSRLLAQDANFAQLAARVSRDPATRFEGGDLGYFTRDGILPAFAEVAFDIGVGEVSAPFQTEYGWHVLTVTDRRRQPRPGIEARRGDIVRFLTLQGIDALLSDIRETYPVSLEAGAPSRDAEGAEEDADESADGGDDAGAEPGADAAADGGAAPDGQ
jgi:peptidyl-prolyl cis-trans isomerase C